MPAKLIVTFPGASLLEQRTHLEHGGLFLPAMEPMPEALSPLRVELNSPYGAPIELEATVVQVFPGTGFALTLPDADAGRRAFEPLFVAAGTDPGRAGPPALSWDAPGEVAPEETQPGEPGVGHGADPKGGDESSETREPAKVRTGTLFDRIRAMSTHDRMSLARYGDRAERAILMKDTTKTIHVFLVQNKGLTADEVRYFAGLRQANPQALEMIADNRTWMQKPGIVAALVRNPKTPSKIAVRLLDKLSRAEVGRIAKTGGAPRAVVDAAKRKITSSKR